MNKIGFITCEDLSRYFPSKKNPLLTHDDQLAADYLEAKGFEVQPVIWGSDLNPKEFNMLVVRSPWDYMDSKPQCDHFFEWLNKLSNEKAVLANPYPLLRWNLDKHYLLELQQNGVSIVPTKIYKPEEEIPWNKHFQEWQEIVFKPTVSAAAKDTYRFTAQNEFEAVSEQIKQLRQGRDFMVQPYIKEVATEGEWSFIFIGGQNTHSILKKPKPGGWLVQDELGGSVHWETPPKDYLETAKKVYQKLCELADRKWQIDKILYARVDILPGQYLGELELVEPELFFLDRRQNKPYQKALQAFYQGIKELSPSSLNQIKSS